MCVCARVLGRVIFRFKHYLYATLIMPTLSAVAPASLPVVALPRLRFAQLDACSTEREGERERGERAVYVWCACALDRVVCHSER